MTAIDQASTAAESTESGNATEATTATAEVTSATTESQAETTATETTEAKAPEVPEAYEFAMPEGVELDKTAADEFSEIAKELKLTQEQAQKVADVAAKQAQRQREAHTQMVESWVSQVKIDKEIGGDKLQENLGIARKALDTFGTPELREVLNATGFGNHPEIIKAFYRAGKAISEDTIIKGNAPSSSADSLAKKMFPTMN